MLKKLNTTQEVEDICNKFISAKLLVVHMNGEEYIADAFYVRRNYFKLVESGATIFQRVAYTGARKLSESDKDDIFLMFTCGHTVSEITKKYGLSDTDGHVTTSCRHSKA